MALALDTLAYARRLREAGFTEQQAEGQAEALAAVMTDALATKVDLESLATRQELHELAARMEIGFERVDSRFREHTALFDARLADLERRMTMRLGGITVASVSLATAVISAVVRSS